MNLLLPKEYEVNEKIKERYQGDLSYMLDYQSFFSKKDEEDILKAINKAKEKTDIMLVIGTGGSLNGTKALSKIIDLDKEILFLGYNYNYSTYKKVLDYLEDKDFVLNIVSKSGKTLEIEVALEIVMPILKKKYQNYEDYVYVTTSPNSPLDIIAKEKGYSVLYIPSLIGGRYSCFTSASLFPLAFGGFDYKAFLEGFKSSTTLLNLSLRYASFLKDMEDKNFFIHAFSFYEEKLEPLKVILIQLFAESHGKDGKGLFPVAFHNSKDLHSTGQFLQEGKNIIFETNIKIDPKEDIYLTKYHRYLSDINEICLQGAKKAHDERYSSSIIEIDKIDEYNLGEFIHFMMLSCINLCLLDNVNPFNQEGVEAYKKNMKAILEN